MGIHYICIPLLLSGIIYSKVPDFVADYDDYEVCEGDACMYKYVFLWLEKTVQVPNRSVTYAESDYFDVNTVGLLADCAPSLSLGDIATHAKSCDDVEWKYRCACNYRKNGWLGEDGVTVKDTLDKDFDEIAGVSKNILKCLGWDGVDDYFDYDYLEESGEKGVRQKREVQSNIPKFLIQGNHNRKKRSSSKRNQKRKQQNKQKGSKRSKGGNRKAGRKGRRKTKREKNHKNKQGQRSSEKKRKISRKNQKRRKKIERNVSNINRKKDKKANKEKKKDKQKKKKERKILKKIGYKAMPSKEILNKLRCVERAIEFGLEECGKEIFQEIWN